MNRRVTVASIAACWTLLLASAASAAPGWSHAVNFPTLPNSGGLSPAVGYQSGGTRTVAFAQVVTSSPLSIVLHVGVIPPGGSYHEQLTVPTSTTTPGEAVLSVAPDGAAVVAWPALIGTNPATDKFSYLASYRPAGSSSWEAPTTILSDSVKGGGNVVTAISSDGTAAVGVDHIDPAIPSPGGSRADVSLHSPGGTWQPPQRVSHAAINSVALNIAFDGHDDLTAAFDQAIATAKYTVEVSDYSPATGSWSAPKNISSSNGTHFAAVNGPQPLAVGADGSAVLAVQYATPATTPDTVATAFTRAGAAGTWTGPQELTSGGGVDLDGSAPRAAGVSADGIAYVLYATASSTQSHDCVGIVRGHVRTTNFSAPVCVSPVSFGGMGGGGGLAFRGNDAYFVWAGDAFASGGIQLAQASRWLDGAGAPDPLTQIDSAPSSASITVVSFLPDQDGSLAALWNVTNGGTTTIRAAAFDAGGPNVMSASVPRSAVASHSVSMNATLIDLWSGLGAVTWSFGDGKTAAGSSVKHTYAKAGSYTVTLMAVDKLGNLTSAKYTIKVSPAPPVLSKVSQSARRWSERHVRGMHYGTTFKFTLSEGAKVTLRFVGKHGRKVGSITIKAHTGRNSYKFKGRISGRHKLSPGRYKVQLTATNGTGQRSSTKTLSFQVVR
jgi:hypothetical protein